MGHPELLLSAGNPAKDFVQKLEILFDMMEKRRMEATVEVNPKDDLSLLRWQLAGQRDSSSVGMDGQNENPLPSDLVNAAVTHCLRILTQFASGSPGAVTAATGGGPAAASGSANGAGEGGNRDSSMDAVLCEAVYLLQKLCMTDPLELVPRVLPPLNKFLQRTAPSVNGVVALAILKFFLDFGDVVLFDAEPMVNLFFRSCLSRQYADAAVVDALRTFIMDNKSKLSTSHSSILPQFFPLLFKVLAWGGPELDSTFEELLPRLLVPSSFLSLFHAILDLPALVLALEDFERGSGYKPGMAPAGTIKSPAPEALLALMDVAYTGSTTTDDGSGAGNARAGGSLEARTAFFVELLRDENESLTEQHWSHPGMALGLKAAASLSKSGRLRHACDVAPSLLMIYFQTAIEDVSQALLCALLPMIFARIDTLFPDESFRLKVQHLCIDAVLTMFGRMPEMICVLRKPIMNVIGQPYSSAAKAELALQLCWAVSEYIQTGSKFRQGAAELFESLELLLYENLAACTALARGVPRDVIKGLSRHKRARLLCVVIGSIAKLATRHRELLPRARVCLAKVSRSQKYLDKRVWRKVSDCLGVMSEPVLSVYVLGPPRCSYPAPSETISSDISAMTMKAKIPDVPSYLTSVPFFLLSEQGGPPYHDFSLYDVLGPSAAHADIGPRPDADDVAGVTC